MVITISMNDKRFQILNTLYTMYTYKYTTLINRYQIHNEHTISIPQDVGLTSPSNIKYIILNTKYKKTNKNSNTNYKYKIKTQMSHPGRGSDKRVDPKHTTSGWQGGEHHQSSKVPSCFLFFIFFTIIIIIMPNTPAC